MAGSDIVIEYDGTPISDHCIFAQCQFEGQMAAIPGSFTVVVRDMGQDQDFTTGKELTLTVDGVQLYGGYVLQVSRSYAFPADDTLTDGPEAVESRQWILNGVDYNILFDKRVLRKLSSQTTSINDLVGPITDGDVIRDYFDNYFDIPAGFDFSTQVVDNYTYTDKFTWDTQGTTMRAVMERLALFGSVFWINAAKQLNYLPYQDTAAPWGFSDAPNGQAIGDDPVPLIGFRDGSYTEDATSVINDALVWGGSEWQANGDVVFNRQQDAASIAAHGRWQVGETHLGELKLQSSVTARAKAIVFGGDSGTLVAGSVGQVNPESQFRCTWFSTDVPVDSLPVHLMPGDVVPIELWVFSDDGGVTPYQFSLPLRQVSMSFPTLDPTGDAYVQFDGFFGLQMSDPYWLWDYLKKQRRAAVTTTVVASGADNDSVDPPPGSRYQGVPSPDPDGVLTTFTIPFPYIGGTLKVFLNGLLQARSTYTESDPATGEFTFDVAPESDDILFCEATLS